MLNTPRILGTTIALLLVLSAWQTYQNASDCRFFGLTYSWFRSTCVGPKPEKRSEPFDHVLVPAREFG
jgi:hypothetical protein